MKLSELKIGETGYIKNITPNINTSKLIQMGFVNGERIKILHYSILSDPIIVEIMNYEISITLEIAKNIEIEKIKSDNSYITNTEEININLNNNFKKIKDYLDSLNDKNTYSCNLDCENCIHKQYNKITKLSIVLIGNPNCGKTTLYNLLTKKNEFTGNYAGATVDIKSNTFTFNNSEITLFDLPGTYSIDKYSAEEEITANFIKKKNFDLIINVIDSTKLKRSLFLTLELKKTFSNVVCALNFFDKFKSMGFELDINKFENNFEIFTEPIISKNGFGITKLLNKCINIIKFIRLN